MLSGCCWIGFSAFGGHVFRSVALDMSGREQMKEAFFDDFVNHLIVRDTWAVK